AARPDLARAKVTVAPLGAPPAHLYLNAVDAAPADDAFATLGRRAAGDTPAMRLSSIAFFDLRTVLRLQDAPPAQELVSLPAARPELRPAARPEAASPVVVPATRPVASADNDAAVPVGSAPPVTVPV
ncbi:hypothetical protein GT354_46215, partial [Streptomyces sp. SID3343]|nr:hypothetical protein [Streptomyces sp. SID3343]